MQIHIDIDADSDRDTFQLLNVDKKGWFLALRGSVLGMISFMRSDGRKDIYSVKRAGSILKEELKAYVLPFLGGIIMEVKRTCI